jgi:hypothetical protein
LRFTSWATVPEIGGADVEPQVRSCSRIRPLSSAAGSLARRRSRSGSLRVDVGIASGLNR